MIKIFDIVKLPAAAPDTEIRLDAPTEKRKAASSTRAARSRQSRRKISDSWTDVLLTLTERVDPVLVKQLLATLPDDSQNRKCLERYASALSPAGEISVEYRQKSAQLDRLYARESLTLGALTKAIRGALCSGRMIDVDMCNAHPVMLLQICEQHKWPAPLLRQYVENRDETLAQISSDRKKAKVLFLKMLFGGTPTGFERNSFVQAFSKELRATADRVWNSSPELQAVVKAENRSNEKASGLSLLMRRSEHVVLKAMCSWLVAQGWELATLVYDGLMVYERAGKRVEHEFHEMQKYVESETGFAIQFEIKAWDTSLLDKK